MPSHRFRLLPGDYCIAKLPSGVEVPPAQQETPFHSVTRTAEETSVICESHFAPSGAQLSQGWRGIALIGPFPFEESGVLASVVSPLAEAGISVMAIATYDTDTLFVPSAELERAAKALVSAGHLLENS
jgi:hypothetical protein